MATTKRRSWLRSAAEQARASGWRTGTSLITLVIWVWITGRLVVEWGAAAVIVVLLVLGIIAAAD